MARRDDDERLGKIAWMYYYVNMNQESIARKLGMSRINVARLLKKALERGIVKIEISSEYVSLYTAEESLRRASHLEHVVVVPTTPYLATDLCRGTAKLLNDNFKTGGNLGIGLSRTLKGLSQFLTQGKCNIAAVVSLEGNTSPNFAVSPINVGYDIAQALSVDFYAPFAPVIAESVTDAKVFKNDKLNALVFKYAREVHMALIGIGTIEDSILFEHGYIGEGDYRKITGDGAVGEVLGNFYRIDGKRVPTDADECLISVDLPMACPVVGVAGGPHKCNAIVGAIKAGFIQGLVTDEDTSRTVTSLLEPG